MPNHHAAQPEEDLVRLYLNDIGKHALLTKDEEARLAQAIEAGREARTEFATTERITPVRKRELRRLTREGDDAATAFVQANLRLVVFIAKKYQGADLPLLDLVQEGNLGLIHAVHKFDWRRGLQVLDLRHLVDPPGHHPRHRRHQSDHSAPAPRRRPAQSGDESPG